MFTDEKYFEYYDTKITVNHKKNENSIVKLKLSAPLSEFKSEANIVDE